MAQSWDVFLESFVNVLLPDGVTPDDEEGCDLLYRLATEKYLDKLRRDGEVEFTWRRYPEGDK
jgi:hypothetical protein